MGIVNGITLALFISNRPQMAREFGIGGRTEEVVEAVVRAVKLSPPSKATSWEESTVKYSLASLRRLFWPWLSFLFGSSLRIFNHKTVLK